MAPSPSHRGAHLLFLTAATVLNGVHAYTWSFQEAPTQCGNLTVAISGSDGTPPYRILIIPFGPSPLANNIEGRKIMDIPFPNSDTKVQFQLQYPGDSQFVAVVSDATGFGSGGTSVAAQVSTSNDSSCFNSTVSVSPDFVFSIEPANQIVQCQDTRIWWDPTTVQGTPNFLGVIPGGQSFSIPEGTLTNVSAEGTGFTWEPSLRGGTTLILVGGDARGNGTAGSSLNVVSSGINNIGSCLSGSSPSSTPGSPAGGSYPTSTTGAGTGSSGGSKNVGAIVGGVVGGLALIVVLILVMWFFRRRGGRAPNRYKERPVDLINADEDDEGEHPAGARNGTASVVRRNELPEYYQPEPFMVPDPTLDGGSTHRSQTATGTMDDARPLSGASSSFYTRATTPDTASGAGLLSAVGGGSSAQGGERRKGAPRPMRAVNYIQHDDAGPSLPLPEEDKDEPETIELPPSYTAVRRAEAAEEERTGLMVEPPTSSD